LNGVKLLIGYWVLALMIDAGGVNICANLRNLPARASQWQAGLWMGLKIEDDRKISHYVKA
jgi:hypothetical protein